MDYTTFRTRLEQLIRSHGYTPHSFAVKLGIPGPTVSRYLSGSRIPELSMLVKIAAFFHVSIDWILGLTEDTNAVLNDDARSLITSYNLATEADRFVVDAVLKKYGR